MRKFAMAALLALGVLVFPVPTHAQEWGRCDSNVAQGNEYVPWAGPWGRHGAGLNVRQDGCGALTWRTYQPCQFGVYDGVCDPVEGGEIGHGGKAVFTLEARVGQATSGRMLARTAAGTPPNFGIVLRLKDDGTMGVEWDGEEWRFCRPWEQRPLCGA